MKEGDGSHSHLRRSRRSSVQNRQAETFRAKDTMHNNQFSTRSIRVQASRKHQLRTGSNHRLARFLVRQASPQPRPPTNTGRHNMNTTATIGRPSDQGTQVPGNGGPRRSGPPQRGPRRGPATVIQGHSGSTARDGTTDQGVTQPTT